MTLSIDNLRRDFEAGELSARERQKAHPSATEGRRRRLSCPKGRAGIPVRWSDAVRYGCLTWRHWGTLCCFAAFPLRHERSACMISGTVMRKDG